MLAPSDFGFFWLVLLFSVFFLFAILFVLFAGDLALLLLLGAELLLVGIERIAHFRFGHQSLAVIQPGFDSFKQLVEIQVVCGNLFALPV